MSYSSELKNYLLTVEEKKNCCLSAFDSGMELRSFNPECPRDTGVFLRGAFIACGSMTDPQKHYYVSFSAPPEKLGYIRDALEAEGIVSGEGVRRGQTILYIRDSSMIEDLISVIGATKYTLELMELKVMKDMRASANRLANADIANSEKTAYSSAAVCAAIEKLQKSKKLSLLPQELIETAELRLANPELSLEELRKLFDKPITKSGLNHRLRRLKEAAEDTEEI